MTFCEVTLSFIQMTQMTAVKVPLTKLAKKMLISNDLNWIRLGVDICEICMTDMYKKKHI